MTDLTNNNHQDIREMVDLAIIGAGPLGIACGIAAKRAGLSAVLLEKGALVNSFVNYPTDLEFFSTPELLEIGGFPFTTRLYKPFRAEAIEYYRHVARIENLDIRLYTLVEGIEGEVENFTVKTSQGEIRARNVAVATGFFDKPRMLDVPGEDLEKVSHYYKEPYAYSNQDVIVVGAKNSAAKVALDCHRHGARVTMIIRGPEFTDSVKYWIKPDLENRIKEESIKAYFNSEVVEIKEKAVTIKSPQGELSLANDWVLAMTGYMPDFDFLQELGIRLQEDTFRTPEHNTETMETNREGVFLAGVICGGLKTSTWFIENSRVHADIIAKTISSRIGKTESQS